MLNTILVSVTIQCTITGISVPVYYVPVCYGLQFFWQFEYIASIVLCSPIFKITYGYFEHSNLSPFI